MLHHESSLIRGDKYLGKINFVFRPKIFNDMLNILNQIFPASIGLKFYPFILDKPP